MSVVAATRPHNGLLARLPSESLASLLPKLEAVDLFHREVLWAADSEIRSVYFPETGLLSLVACLDDGMQIEVGLIDNAGVAGASVASGVSTSFHECVVQIPGRAYRIGAAAFRKEVRANPALGALLVRYSEAVMAQVSQTAACNGRHDLELRLVRWLLMAHDSTEGDELRLSQDYLATMLGVHRPTVTVTAGILQRAGLIRYSSGRVVILDRAGLEAASCDCYAAVRQRTELILGPVPL